jgi:uncharacterized membrane protein
MARLKKLIRKLPHEEYNEAVNYYEQFFADGGQINETPEQAAKNILADYTLKKPSPNAIWILLSLPVSLPLAIVALSIVFVGYALLLSFFALAIAITGAGVGSVFGGFAVMAQHFPTMMFMVGTGLIEFALGLLSFNGIIKLAGLINEGLSTVFSKLIRRSWQ